MTAINVRTFVKYVLSFYGEGGIYEFGATKGEVILAIRELLERRSKEKDSPEFVGDSLDREHIRDIILDERTKL